MRIPLVLAGACIVASTLGGSGMVFSQTIQASSVEVGRWAVASEREQHFASLPEACGRMAARLRRSPADSVVFTGDVKPTTGIAASYNCQYSVTSHDGKKRTMWGPPVTNLAQ